MRTRLVVGGNPIARRLIQAVCDRPGRLLVVDPPDDVGCENTPGVERVDVNPSDLETIEETVDSVVLVAESSTENRRWAEAAREAFPEAFLLAYTEGEDHTAPLQEIADSVIDLGDTLGSYLEERLETRGVPVYELRKVLANIDGPLAVVMHNNPDPDAIASALAVVDIANRMGCEAEPCYYGSINHQQNRAFVNILDLELQTLDAETDLSEYGGFALVDHARPGVNDNLPEDLEVDIIIDHHPPRGPITAEFTDLRSTAGATSTLLVDYYKKLDVPVDEVIATSLLFGIWIDTNEFSREVSVPDFEAGAFLVEQADLGTLERIESPRMSSDTFETIAQAIHNRETHGSVLLSSVGTLNDRDTLAQSADRLLALEGVSTTLVYGFKDGTIYISARTRGTDLDLGETLRAAFGQIGSAGGHADMAGAQIELGIIEEITEDDEAIQSIVTNLVTDQFLDVLEVHPSEVSLGAYGASPETGREGL